MPTIVGLRVVTLQTKNTVAKYIRIRMTGGPRMPAFHSGT